MKNYFVNLAEACRKEVIKIDKDLKENESFLVYVTTIYGFSLSFLMTKLDDLFKRNIMLRQKLGNLGLRRIAVFLRSIGWIP